MDFAVTFPKEIVIQTAEIKVVAKANDRDILRQFLCD
jgi:hypothetical protein